MSAQSDPYERKYHLLLRLKENTYSIEQLIEKGDPEVLVSEIHARENLIRSIDDIDTQIALLRTTCPHLGSAMDTCRKRWMGLLTEVLHEIDSGHSKCISNARTKAKELQDEIQRVRTSSKAMRGYSPAKYSGPRFLDVSK